MNSRSAGNPSPGGLPRRWAMVWLAVPGLLIWAAAALSLQAGVARVNITPPEVVDVPMSGYSDIRSQGLHDSLYARVLVLHDGATTMAVAAVDLIGLNVDFDQGSGPEDVAPGRLAGMLQAEGMTGWLIVSTHTHGGPQVLELGTPYSADRSWPVVGASYTDWVEERIASAVRAAMSSLQPVRIAVGRGQVDLSFNRRLVRADGAVEMIWGRASHFTPEQLGPTDPEVGVVRLDDLQGRPLAVLFHYACHAVVLGGGNRLLTADFPGSAMAYVEQQFPGALGLFLQGAAGDLDPYIDVQNHFGPAREQGETLGREAVRVARELETGGTIDAELEWIALERRFRRFHDPGQQVSLRFGVLRLGHELALLALPGEPFVGLQLELKRRSPARYTFLLGYANGYAGYFPTVQANREGGYGASYGETMHVEARAGETMVELALAELEKRYVLPTAVSQAEELAGSELQLEPNIPNPFNNETVIRFFLPVEASVELAVFNLAGQQLATLLAELLPTGSYTVRWNGRDSQGRSLSSAIYLCRLQAGSQVETRKLLLLR